MAFSGECRLQYAAAKQLVHRAFGRHRRVESQGRSPQCHGLGPGRRTRWRRCRHVPGSAQDQRHRQHVGPAQRSWRHHHRIRQHDLAAVPVGSACFTSSQGVSVRSTSRGRRQQFTGVPGLPADRSPSPAPTVTRSAPMASSRWACRPNRQYRLSGLYPRRLPVRRKPRGLDRQCRRSLPVLARTARSRCMRSTEVKAPAPSPSRITGPASLSAAASASYGSTTSIRRAFSPRDCATIRASQVALGGVQAGYDYQTPANGCSALKAISTAPTCQGPGQAVPGLHRPELCQNRWTGSGPQQPAPAIVLEPQYRLRRGGGAWTDDDRQRRLYLRAANGGGVNRFRSGHRQPIAAPADRRFQHRIRAGWPDWTVRSWRNQLLGLGGTATICSRLHLRRHWWSHVRDNGLHPRGRPQLPLHAGRGRAPSTESRGESRRFHGRSLTATARFRLPWRFKRRLVISTGTAR